MVNAESEVTLRTSYTPWGDTLEVHGTGSFTSGYFGGIMDAATGLLYVGNGQYYDPATGRFLTRDAKPDQTNPYAPWRSDPAGAVIAPLALLAMVYGGKKSRGKWDHLLILMALCGTVGMSLSACNPGPIEVDITSQVETPSATLEVTQGATVIASMPIPTSTATSIPTGTCYLMTSHPLKTIFFGGSNGANLANSGPDPSIQTPVWTAIADEVFPYIGPNKAAQANSVNIESYKDDNLLLWRTNVYIPDDRGAVEEKQIHIRPHPVLLEFSILRIALLVEMTVVMKQKGKILQDKNIGMAAYRVNSVWVPITMTFLGTKF